MVEPVQMTSHPFKAQLSIEAAPTPRRAGDTTNIRALTFSAWLAAFLLLAVSTRAQNIIKAEATTPAEPTTEVETNAEPLTEEERIGILISTTLSSTAEAQALNRRREMEIITGDIRRVAGLPPERLRILEVAAKGAVDRSLDNWRASQEQHVRQQAQGFTVAAVQQRIANAGEVQVGQSSAADQPLWVQTLSQTLTPQEQQLYAQAEADRRAYREQAIKAVLMAELERRLGLTAAQSDKLAPLAERTLIDYLPDMANYIDRSGGIDFRMLLLVMSGMNPAEAQAIITPAQWERWQQSTADYAGWWQGIEQQHRARLGGKKQ